MSRPIAAGREEALLWVSYWAGDADTDGSIDLPDVVAFRACVSSPADGDGVAPINPADPIHVRCDVVTDGKIDASDGDLVQSLATEGLDGTGIACP